MSDQEKIRINLEPLYTYFNQEIFPKEFALLLDEFLYHYVHLLVQAIDKNETAIHKNTTEFLHYIKILRDILPECEK